LKQGRSLIVVEAENDHQISAATEVLKKNGSEDIEEARQQWQAVSSQEELRRAS
jgi:hypothetical protein